MVRIPDIILKIADRKAPQKEKEGRTDNTTEALGLL